MKKTVQLFFKILIIGIVISVVISSWAWGFEALDGSKFIVNSPLGKDFSIYIFSYGALLTIINILFFRYFDKEIDWEKHKQWAEHRFVFGFVFGAILTLLSVFLIRFVIVVGFEQQSLKYFISDN